MSPIADPLLDAIVLLARAGIEFVVVGVQGINFYARDAADAVVTQDVDVFLPRRAEAKLLRSKELAGRPKDVEFLRMFAARLRPEIDSD